MERIDRWIIITDGPGAPDWNMALDESLLIHAANTGSPILRSYSWNLPAATFGYSQRWSEIQNWTELPNRIRRCTGGGLVLHENDWTYSIAIPPSHPWYQLTAIESYRTTHEAVKIAFQPFGVATNLAPEADLAGPGQCFIGAEKFDLLWSGRKIGGAAQRRNRNGLLIQGSIQPIPPGIDRGEWVDEFGRALARTFGGSTEISTPNSAQIATARELMFSKYQSPDYLRRR